MDHSLQETYTLPSGGKIYDTAVNPQITIKSMTTMDEMVRLSPSELPYKNLVDVIDSCLVGEDKPSVYDLCMGDFQFLLYKLRRVTYGPEYRVTLTCPYCKHRSEEVINIDELETIQADEEAIEKYSEFDLPISGYTVELNFETPRMIDEITDKVKHPSKHEANIPNLALLYTVSYFIKSIDGRPATPEAVFDWVKQLPMKDTNTILAYADKLNATVGVQTKVHAKCDICKIPFIAQMKVNSEFFRPTLDI